MVNLVNNRPVLLGGKIAGVEFTDHYFSVHPSDHDLWINLWISASQIDMNLSAILQYLRNCGCQLVRAGQTYVIRPHTMSEQDYQRERQHLIPYKDQVMQLLERLVKEAK